MSPCIKGWVVWFAWALRLNVIFIFEIFGFFWHEELDVTMGERTMADSHCA